jgi:hypothetical protein
VCPVFALLLLLLLFLLLLLLLLLWLLDCGVISAAHRALLGISIKKKQKKKGKKN